MSSALYSLRDASVWIFLQHQQHPVLLLVQWESSLRIYEDFYFFHDILGKFPPEKIYSK